MQCIQAPGSPLVVTHKQTRLKRHIVRESSTNSECYPDGSAVYIKNLCKHYYSGTPVLQNLCMNVGKGTIYGLLGASGCGKSTILSCIVGLAKWNSGDVQVFGKRPGTKESGIPGKRLGYMPQETALYNELSILEIIRFYARIYNMTTSEMKERLVFLNKLLNLPDNSKRIVNLSGGQRRRASLALALIHSPELLILDEPTVGLDPLLRMKIWEYLYEMVKISGTTIIVTTHYIEEARQANTIGIIRSGRLLVEDKPLVLLEKHQRDLLEQVVLQLCRDDENTLESLYGSNIKRKQGNQVCFKSAWNTNVSSYVANIDEDKEGIYRKNYEFDCEKVEHATPLKKKTASILSNSKTLATIQNTGFYHSLQKIYGLTTVILLGLQRYNLFLFLLLILPTFKAAITISVLGTQPIGMKLGIVNNELKNWTEECPHHKDVVSESGFCDFNFLSCKYLSELERKGIVALSAFDSESDALHNVQRGNIIGYMTFASRYSQSALDFAAARLFADNDTIEESRVHVHLDNSHYVTVIFVIKHVISCYVDYVNKLADTCNLPAHETEVPPLFFRTPVYGTNGDEFSDYILPGVILTVLLSVISCVAAIAFIGGRSEKNDRKEGTLSRARVAGLTTIDIFSSHIVSEIIITFFQMVILGLVLLFYFDFKINGSLWLCMLFCVLVGLCGAVGGILLGIICNDEVEAIVFEIFLVPFLLVFGGVLWPTENMPRGWQFIGYIFPTSLPTKSLRTVVVRGLGLMHPLVWPGFALLLLWTVILFILSVIAYRIWCK